MPVAIDRFEPDGRGKWKGPCPFCGGEDRFLVSNGKYRCRKCLSGGLLPSEIERRKSFSPEQLAEFRRKEEEEEIERLWKIRNKQIALANSSLDLKFHKNMLENEPFQMDGATHYPQSIAAEHNIPLSAIERFHIGFCPSHTFWYRATVGDQKVLQSAASPSLTFPTVRGTKLASGGFQRLVTGIEHRYLNALSAELGVRYRPHQSEMGVDYFRCLDPIHNLAPGWVIWCEGAKKAITFWRHGFAACGVTGALKWQDRWADELRRFGPKGVLLMFDNDLQESVRNFAHKLADTQGFKLYWTQAIGKPDDLLHEGLLTTEEILHAINE